MVGEIYSSSGSRLRLMVTWLNSSETRPAPKGFRGMLFEANKPTAVEHLPEQTWRAMIDDINHDSRGTWSYEYVVEEPPPEPEAEDPPLQAEGEDEGGETRAAPRSKPSPKKVMKKFGGRKRYR